MMVQREIVGGCEVKKVSMLVVIRSRGCVGGLLDQELGHVVGEWVGGWVGVRSRRRRVVIVT